MRSASGTELGYSVRQLVPSGTLKQLHANSEKVLKPLESHCLVFPLPRRVRHEKHSGRRRHVEVRQRVQYLCDATITFRDCELAEQSRDSHVESGAAPDYGAAGEGAGEVVLTDICRPDGDHVVVMLLDAVRVDE